MYEQAYWEGVAFDEFLEGVEANRAMWQAMAPRARVAGDQVERARDVPGRWRLLVVAEDWCGDAVNILPVVARLVEQVDALELRIVDRDAHPDLMGRHLTNGTRSIPVVILLDEGGSCRGWWGPRPLELQALFEAEVRLLPKEHRYPVLRRWYARDRGESTAEEIVDLIVCAALSVPCGDAAQPCEAASG
jgi:hypothetical protein